MNKILEGAKEALEIARGNAFPARISWFMEFEKGKSAKIVVEGPFDQEVIEAMRDYLARQEARIPITNGKETSGE